MEFVTGVARNVNLDLTYASDGDAAGNAPRKVESAEARFELDGHKIVLDTHVESDGRWRYPIRDGDSLIGAVDKLTEPKSTGETEFAAACKNLSRGYTVGALPPVLYFIFFLCLGVSSFFIMTARLQIFHRSDLVSRPEAIHVALFAPIVGWLLGAAAAVFAAGVLWVFCRNLHGVFLLRRYALEAAAGAAGDLKQRVVFPARAVAAWRAGDRIAVVGEKTTPTGMTAIVFENLTSGASGAAEGWARILLRVGWKLAAAAYCFYFFQDHLDRDFAAWDDPRFDDIVFSVQAWFRHFVPLAGFVWFGLMLLDEFFAWRLRREARRRLNAMQKAA
jgi:hypothetical protein